jgi:hypothetical protein
MRKLFFADKKHHEQQAKLAFPTTLKSTLRLGLILREIFTCIPFLFGQLSRKMKRCVYFIKNKFYWQCRLSVSARLGISFGAPENVVDGGGSIIELQLQPAAHQRGSIMR